MLTSGDIAFVTIVEENHVNVTIIKSRYFQDVYEEPIASSKINIFYIENTSSIPKGNKVINKSDLIVKMVCLFFQTWLCYQMSMLSDVT